MDYLEAVRLTRFGDERGFGYLYENTYKSKYYLALRYMKNREAAEDVLQDSYLRAFSKLDTLNEPEHFPAWLGQIVANTAKNALVRNNPVLFTDVAAETEIDDFEEWIEDEDMTSQPEYSYTREETRTLVHELIDALSEEQRLCVLMFHIEGMSIKEIARILGCSENTVKLCGGSKGAGGFITSVGMDANYRSGWNVDDLNRFMSSFTDYRFTEENDSDTPYGTDVDGNTLWMFPAELSFEVKAKITDAAYLEDTMVIHFSYEKNSYENGLKAADKTATLKKDGNGKFRIITIEEGNLPAEWGTETKGDTETADQAGNTGDTASIRAIYEGSYSPYRSRIWFPECRGEH